MKLSEKGLEFIKKSEGCKLCAYRDSVGIPTIGWGHTKGVRMGTVITFKQAESYLKEDIEPCERLLNSLGVSFRQEQFDALVSWIFNLGTGKFTTSTLKRHIVSRRSEEEIADQIIRWIYAGDKPLLGLKRRRIAEANMYVGKELYYLDKNSNIKKRRF